jgi:hypothetical protein
MFKRKPGFYVVCPCYDRLGPFKSYERAEWRAHELAEHAKRNPLLCQHNHDIQYVADTESAYV